MRTGPAREKADFPRIVRMGNPAEVRGAPMEIPRTLSIDCVGRCGGYPSALKHRRHSVKSESRFSNCTFMRIRTMTIASSIVQIAIV